MSPAIQLTALICGVVLALAEVAVIFLLARRDSGGEIGCLPAVGLLLIGSVAVALVVTGLTGVPATTMIFGV
ncbi:MAG: hypothetical protein WC054_00970 [Candidatus Nanopelagicales bacterium]